MLIALASPSVASTVNGALRQIEWCMADAASQGARIVCFPEAFLPGLRGLDFEVAGFPVEEQGLALRIVTDWARQYRIATVLGMELMGDDGLQIVSVVVDRHGVIQGLQTKNQLDPTEEGAYVPGDRRQLFEIDGLRFGVAICHEGFRYPETVRWAATRGASLVFHPQCTGSDLAGPELSAWGAPDAPYYEKAVMCRALENGIWIASVNYGFRYQESATSVISPTGECVARLPYGYQGVLVHEIDPALATGLLASRYAPERYREAGAGVGD